MLSNVTIQSRDEVSAPAPQGGGCGCGCGGGDATPRLFVRQLPKKIRHGAILGALSSLAPGERMELVAPHEPRGLLRQLAEVAPGAFEMEHVEDPDPEVYVLGFTRL